MEKLREIPVSELEKILRSEYSRTLLAEGHALNLQLEAIADGKRDPVAESMGRCALAWRNEVEVVASLIEANTGLPLRIGRHRESLIPPETTRQSTTS